MAPGAPATGGGEGTGGDEATTPVGAGRGGAAGAGWAEAGTGVSGDNDAGRCATGAPCPTAGLGWPGRTGRTGLGMP